MNFDRKASATGHEPITLAQATVAFHFKQFGVVEMAERSVQDLFVSIKAYRLGVPRLRLFAAFLGDGRDLDPVVADMLKTPQAVAVYFNLLIEVHREMDLVKFENLKNLEQVIDAKLMHVLTLKKNTNDEDAVVVVDNKTIIINNNNENNDKNVNNNVENNDDVNGTDVENKNNNNNNNDNDNKDVGSSGGFENDETAMIEATEQKLKTLLRIVQQSLQQMLLASENMIETLFPATDDTFIRFDKREVWCLNPSLLKKSLSRWLQAQKYLHGKHEVYIELVEKLKLNSAGEAEVDDFLWIILQQWCKLEDWAMKRADLKCTSFLHDHEVLNKNPSRSLLLTTNNTTSNNDDYERLTTKNKKNETEKQNDFLFMNLLPIKNITNLLESIYRPGEGYYFTNLF
jgi:hypothetical protein